jgi:ubiquinone/menaquinone biosynthesis C-methylase UbiE
MGCVAVHAILPSMPATDNATTAAQAETSRGGLQYRSGPQQKYVDTLRGIVTPGTRWLDIGCGRQVAPDWALSNAEQAAAFGAASLIGIDVDAAITQHPLLKGRAFALADDLPFQSSSFDLVTANMVMEHVLDPARVLREVNRVLRPGGVFVFHTPNYLYYPMLIASLIPQRLKLRIISSIEGRDESDVFPTVYRINTAAAIHKLAEETGFAVSKLQHNAPSRVFFRGLPIVRTIEAQINKLLARPWAERYRSNLLVILSKPGQ